MNDHHLGYPARALVVLAAALGLVLVLGILRLAPEVKWALVAVIVVAAGSIIAVWSHRINCARKRSVEILSALGAVTADLPRSLRTRMPLVLVVGDALDQLFHAEGRNRLAHVGDGAIWVRVERAQDMSRLALVLRQWRDGRAPDGIVLALAPALYGDQHALTHSLRLMRQAASDTSRLLGTHIPGYLALYQRLTSAAPDDAVPQWFGVSRGQPIQDADAFEAVMQAAEAQAQRAHAQTAPAWRAAALPDLVSWTRRSVLSVLQDRTQPASVWPLFGIAWIDCGPINHPTSPWNRHVQERTHLTAPPFAASQARWPLPQPLLAALPQRAWISPRWRALAHALVIVAVAAALAGWAAATNNRTLLTQVSNNIVRFSSIPAANDAARRHALDALTVDRNRLERYQRTGVPLHLSFGMYRGVAVLPTLNTAIVSYQPPAPPPAPTIVTLDSMSLFASGQAKLKPGSNRAMVAALEMIKAHPANRILVAGHTDNVGDPASNQRLSLARASAVRDWLTEAAEMAPSRFAMQGYGDTRPIADNQTDSGRARNRRVDITLVPDVSGT